MSDKPEALRLADALEVDKWHISGVTAQSAADELRRLHAVNQELTENLEKKSSAIQRIWKERDELRKVNQGLEDALRLIASAENSALDLAYCKGIARAAIAKAEAA